MKRFRSLRSWTAGLLAVATLTMCQRKEKETEAAPESVSSIAAYTCAYSIKASEYKVDGSNIPAGSYVCIEAGTRGPLLLQNFKGTAANPITFINKGGKVVVKATGSFGIKTENCSNFKMLGNGDPAIKYGIEVDGPTLGMTFDKLSTDYEVSNTEIHNTGFAGFMGKTDPSCDQATWRGNFTMRNILLHDNYVHDVEGEGFYVGNSFYANGRSLSCGTILPHSVENVKIYDNIVYNSGCEGIQLGCAIKGAEIYRNTVTNFGQNPFANYQNNGIQIGEGTGGKCYNNIIKNGPGNGIILLGLGDNVVYNNLILNSGGSGFFVDERYTPGSFFKIINNTIINPGGDGLKLYSEKVAMNTVMNNVIIKPGTGKYITTNSGVRLTDANNYKSNDISACQFIDPSANNYQLKSTSPLINAGADASSHGVNIDYYYTPRPYSASFDIGATEYKGSVVTNPTPTPDPTPTPTPDPDPTPAPTPETQSVASLTLINADTDKDIATLTNGYVIDFSKIGTKNLNIRANTSPSKVGSVVFALDGNSKYRVESGYPYAIGGDAGITSYAAWVPTVGNHTLTVTPYTGSSASGTAGKALTVSFQVTSGTVTPTPTPTPEPGPGPAPTPGTALKFAPTEDAFLHYSTGYNYNILRVAPSYRTAYIKYNVAGLNGAKPTSAKLKFKVEGDNGSGTIRVGYATGGTWTESTLSGTTKPASVTSVGSLNTRFDIGKYYEVDVTKAVNADGVVTLVVSMDSGGSDFAFSSSEGSYKPELVVTM